MRLTRFSLLLSVLLVAFFWCFQYWMVHTSPEEIALRNVLKHGFEPSVSTTQLYSVFSSESLPTIPTTNYEVRPLEIIEQLPEKIATEKSYTSCMESLKPLVAKVSQAINSTVHERLAIDVGKLAVEATCRSSRIWWTDGNAHFDGGRKQYERYLASRGWKRVRPKIVPTDLPKSTVLAIVPCFTNLPTLSMQQNRTVRLISTSPKEREHAEKFPFFLSTKALYDQNNCDYRRFYPETHVVDSQTTCEQLVDHINKENRPERIWFLKFAKESFGQGIVIRKAHEALANELSSCEQFGASSTNTSRILFQHGVENIFKFEDRYTQGRAYILVSNYDPATAWFFMGYFNVAAIRSKAAESDVKSNDVAPDSNQHTSIGGGTEIDKAALITNLKSNQKSKRLLFRELMEGYNPQGVALTYHNIKRAALTTFLALKQSLRKTRGSFSLIGFDYLIQTDFEVKVLETNCNCELFFNVSKFGNERVMCSTMLMDGMMDIVLASNLNLQEFGEVLKKHLEMDEKRFKDPKEAFGSGGNRYPGIGNWELIYSEAVEPVFQYVNVFDDAC